MFVWFYFQNHLPWEQIKEVILFIKNNTVLLRIPTDQQHHSNPWCRARPEKFFINNKMKNKVWHIQLLVRVTDELDIIRNNCESYVFISSLSFNLELFKITPKEKEKSNYLISSLSYFQESFHYYINHLNELWNAFRQEDSVCYTCWHNKKPLIYKKVSIDSYSYYYRKKKRFMTANPGDPPISSSPALGLHVYTTTAGFYVGIKCGQHFTELSLKSSLLHKN